MCPLPENRALPAGKVPQCAKNGLQVCGQDRNLPCPARPSRGSRGSRGICGPHPPAPPLAESSHRLTSLCHGTALFPASRAVRKPGSSAWGQPRLQVAQCPRPPRHRSSALWALPPQAWPPLPLPVPGTGSPFPPSAALLLAVGLGLTVRVGSSFTKLRESPEKLIRSIRHPGPCCLPQAALSWRGDPRGFQIPREDAGNSNAHRRGHL